MKQANLFYHIRCRLGEGAMWDHRRNTLFWIDIENKRLHAMALPEKHHRSWQLHAMIGTIVPDLEGNIILAMQDHLARFNPETGQSEAFLRLSAEPKDNRCNDGKCDCFGRLWLGTMNLQERPEAGSLYCIFPDGSVERKIPKATIANGIVWTKDRDKMYWIDTPRRAIFEYAFDAPTGAIRYLREAVKVPASLGYPDGMTIDENDQLWVAHWDGAGVYHWDPASGELLEKISLPVPRVTSCVFGGKQLDQLYVTTAWTGLSAEQIKKYPLSGSVFVVEAGTRGFLPEPFAG
jgi:sugar lactone lactonase YvrE